MTTKEMTAPTGAWMRSTSDGKVLNPKDQKQLAGNYVNGTPMWNDFHFLAPVEMVPSDLEEYGAWKLMQQVPEMKVRRRDHVTVENLGVNGTLDRPGKGSWIVSGRIFASDMDGAKYRRLGPVVDDSDLPDTKPEEKKPTHSSSRVEQTLIK